MPNIIVFGKEVYKIKALDFDEDGVQILYKFPNNFGASLIKSNLSYGGKDGLWELAVIKWEDDETFNIHYNNSVADGDIRGYLTDKDVEALLEEIEKFEA
jgi:hypothetical protein